MPLRELWRLEPDLAFLNHGSYGACPAAVLNRQEEWRIEMERQPVAFLGRDLEARLNAARAEVASFVGARPENLVFVANATTGVNTVLRWFPLRPGDQLLVTDHAYNACRNALDVAAAAAGAEVVVAHIPFPLASEDATLEAILAAVTPRTRLALIDHVTSPTALVLPLARIVRELAARGVQTLVDGAHAPGMLPLDLESLGAAFYTGNGHKWLCAPKGAGFLYVREDWHNTIRPLVISHGANRVLEEGETRLQVEFAWTGTADPSPYLCLPEAIRYLGSLLPGGWEALYAANHKKAVAARRTLLGALDIPEPCPESMLGSMAAIPLPPRTEAEAATWADPLQALLLRDHRIEVPLLSWPLRPARLLRISAQLYNEPDEYARLAAVLASTFRRH
jgi:isopenicillin-N epimerase